MNNFEPEPDGETFSLFRNKCKLFLVFIVDYLSVRLRQTKIKAYRIQCYKCKDICRLFIVHVL